MIAESDKLFILALSGLGLFAGELIASIYCAQKNLTVQDLSEAIKFTGTLVTMAWTYYFATKKSGNGNQAKPQPTPTQ